MMPGPKQLRVFVALLALFTIGQEAYGQACVFGACTAMTNEFRTGELRPQSIALLPPHAALRKKKMLMAEDMVGESAPLEDALAAAIEARLTDLGYAVRVVPRGDLETDGELANLVLQANQRYDEEREKIVAKFRDVKYRRYSAGSETRLLANYLGVDAVAFARMDAVGATGAAIAFSPTGGGQIRMDLAIVHGETGAVEAFFGKTDTGGLGPGKSIAGILKKPDKHAGKVTKKATKGFPKADKLLSAQKLDPERVQAADVQDGASEEQVLSDLESLLDDSEDEAVPPVME